MNLQKVLTKICTRNTGQNCLLLVNFSACPTTILHPDSVGFIDKNNFVGK